MVVGWKSAGQRTISRAEAVGMGGLFLYTPTPLPAGSILELLFDLKSGEVRARAIVRHCDPGKGMGVQFVQMLASDRARLTQFLARQQAAAEAVSDRKPGIRKPVQPSPGISGQNFAEKTSDDIQIEQELNQLLELARKGTHYQLLGVVPEAPVKQIKQSFYAQAQRFHPDHHMAKREWMEPLKQLMGAFTEAYKTLSDEQRRARYDKQLEEKGAYSLSRNNTAAQDAIGDYVSRATECLRARNFAGSIVWLRKCVEIAPDEAKFRAMLARSLGAIPQYRSEAIEQFQRAIDIDPWNTDAYLQFAELFEEMQLSWRARPLYSKILEINPVHAKARERLDLLDGEKDEKLSGSRMAGKKV
jgi:curved DNA-binding protein CbpA